VGLSAGEGTRSRAGHYEVPGDPEPPVRERAGALGWTGLVAVAAAAVAADQITKSIATRALELNESRDLLPLLSLTRIHNTGIAFGRFAGQQDVIMLLTAAAIVWMTVFFLRTGGRHVLFPVALGLLIGGASSNLFDRVRAGFVTDFIHVHHWPIFNLADIFICSGVVLLMLGLAAHDRASPR
jgi:signal peptidase II